MNKTIFSVLSFAVIAVLALSLVSAFDFSLSTPASMNLAKNSTTSIISYSGSDSINVSFSLSKPTGFDMSTPSPITNVSSSSSRTVNLGLTSLPSTLNFDNSYPFTLTAYAVNATNSTDITNKSVNFNFVKTFCKAGATNKNLSITNVNIDTTGDDSDVWKVLDVITVEVEVKNNGDGTVRDVQVELGLFDSAGKNFIGNLDFDSTDEEKIEIGSLGSSDRDTATFVFTVPADFDINNYKLAVKTYSDRDGESVECSDTSNDLDRDFYQPVSVERQDDDGKYIAFDKIKVVPSEATCGDTVGLTFDTLNVGDSDQDRVKVRVYGKELKVDTYSEIKTSFDMGEKKSMSFTFAVPQGLTDKTYYVELSSEYDYRSDTYRKQSDDVVKVPIKVIGCTPVSTKLAAVSAVLSSEAAAGKEMVVTVAVRNLGVDVNTFAVDATGYSAWATLSSVSGNVLTLSPGDAREVTFKFNVNSDASGSKTFTVNAASGNSVESKEVTVNLAEKASGFSLDLSGNGMLWIIGIVNIVLIIIIIIVAVRVSRR
jgi:hypothetical protein